MAHKTEAQYNVLCNKIEGLLNVVDDNVPITDPVLVELDMLSGLVYEYEKEHYPIIPVVLASRDKKGTSHNYNCNYVKCDYLDSVHREPNEETLSAMQEAESGVELETLDWETIDL